MWREEGREELCEAFIELEFHSLSLLGEIVYGEK